MEGKDLTENLSSGVNKEDLHSFNDEFKQLLRPTLLESFTDSYPAIEVLIYKDALSQPSKLLLTGLPSYCTVQDLLISLWIETGKTSEFHPSYVFMGYEPAKMEAEGEKQGQKRFESLTGRWTSTYEANKENESDAYLYLPNPIENLKANEYLEGFVDSEGEIVSNRFEPRHRIRLEDIIPAKSTPIVQFHVFTMKTFLRVYSGNQPIPEQAWNGMFRPYFPTLSPEGPFEASQQELQYAIPFETDVKAKKKQLAFLNSLLTEQEVSAPKTTGIYYLYYIWTKKQEEFQGCDIIFYSYPATPKTPFLRYLPYNSQSMTKLYRRNEFSLPTINDPQLLKQWVHEEPTVENKDSLTIKVTLRESENKLPGIYGSLNVFQDGTANFIVYPPKGIRALNITSDLQFLETTLENNLQGLSLKLNDAKLHRAVIHVGFNLERSMKRITPTILRQRIKKVSTYFQELPIPENERMTFFMRYKNVSNFVREDSIALFLTLMSDKVSIQGGAPPQELIVKLANEFSFSQDEATRHVADWLQGKNEYVLANSLTDNFISEENPGIDIAIYDQHPLYSIHLYNISSGKDFQRICTLLSLLWLTESDYWQTSEKEVQQIVEAEEVSIPLASTQSVNEQEQEQDKPDQTQERQQKPQNQVVVQNIVQSNYQNQNQEDTAFLNIGENDGEEFEEIGVVEGLPTVNEEESKDESPALEAMTLPVTTVKPAIPSSAATVTATAASSTLKGKELDEKIVDDDKKLLKEETLEKEKGKGKGKGKKSAKEEKGLIKGKEGEKPIIAFSFFIDRLKDLDPTLFKYKNPPTGVKHYTSNCAANWDRQPLILTKQEFTYLQDVYADDEDLAFVIYGESDWKSVKTNAIKKGLEIVYVLKYGSDPVQPNYYLCCEFFCLRDRLMIRREDWFSKKDREGNPKGSESCPFCHGLELLIKKRSAPGDNQVVIRRIIKPNTDLKDEKRHLYVNFLKDAKHPDGYALPCCFTSSKDIDYENTAFKKMRDAYKPLASAAPSSSSSSAASSSSAREEDDDVIEEAISAEDKKAEETIEKKKLGAPPDLGTLQWKISKEYILGSEKYPLDSGKVGICSQNLDIYFGQSSSKLVARTAIKQEIKPSSQGFFRVGVENNPQELPNSLFSAIAPYLGLNTSESVAELISLNITPRVFLQLNFGNLLLEFFNPATKPDSDYELQKFANKHLQTDINLIKPELSRFKRSYDNFKNNYVLNPTETKQLRHFIHALAEPGLLSEHGILLIVLEYDRDPHDPNVEVDVKCPSLGIDTDRYSQNDIAFITKYLSKDGTVIWEPLIYLKKPNVTSGNPYTQEGYYTLTKNIVTSLEFPSYIKNRIMEFMEKCAAPYRGVYTAQSDVDSRFLLPIDKALLVLEPLKPYALVRDSYNHLIAITVIPERKSGSLFQEVIIPVADDGTLYHDTTGLHIHLGFSSIHMGNAYDVYRVYQIFTKNLDPPLQSYSSIYNLLHFLKEDRRDRSTIYGYVIGGPKNTSYGTITLPCAETKADDTPIPPALIKTITNRAPFEFEINKEISDSDTDKRYESNYLLKKEEAEEIYQTLRLIFSNWLASDKAGPNLRERILALFEQPDLKALPLYEKRKRLQLELEPLIASWLSPDPDPYTVKPLLLRKNCIDITDASSCSGNCVWKEMDDTESGKCYLHTPSEIQVSSDHTSSSLRFLSLRLFDEILRIPKRRQELVEHKVSRIRIPMTNIQIDDQWIIPEKALVWYDLLRPSVKDNDKEIPTYYEEYSRPAERKQLKNVNETESKEEEEKEEKEEEGKGNDEELPPEFSKVPGSVLSLLHRNVRPQFILRNIGNEDLPSLVSFLSYFKIPKEQFQFKEDDTIPPVFTPETSKILSMYLNKPIVQVLSEEELPQNMYVEVGKTTFIQGPVIVFIPDAPTGAAIMVLKESLNDSIPLSLLDGAIKQRIESYVAPRRKIGKIKK